MVHDGGRLRGNIAELGSCAQGAALEGLSPAIAWHALARKSGVQFASMQKLLVGSVASEPQLLRA